MRGGLLAGGLEGGGAANWGIRVGGAASYSMTNTLPGRQLCQPYQHLSALLLLPTPAAALLRETDRNMEVCLPASACYCH